MRQKVRREKKSEACRCDGGAFGGIADDSPTSSAVYGRHAHAPYFINKWDFENKRDKRRKRERVRRMEFTSLCART